jgi:hypothetical protein
VNFLHAQKRYGDASRQIYCHDDNAGHQGVIHDLDVYRTDIFQLKPFLKPVPQEGYSALPGAEREQAQAAMYDGVSARGRIYSFRVLDQIQKLFFWSN